jgi:hypothetical protein
MIRALLVTTVIATLALSACGDNDSDDQANSRDAATTTTNTTTNNSGDLEAWCLGLSAESDELNAIEDLQTYAEADQRRMEALLEVAPAEIAEVNQAIVDFGRELNAYLADNDWDPNSPRLDGTSRYDADLTELEQFAVDNC